MNCWIVKYHELETVFSSFNSQVFLAALTSVLAIITFLPILAFLSIIQFLQNRGIGNQQKLEMKAKWFTIPKILTCSLTKELLGRTKHELNYDVFKLSFFIRRMRQGSNSKSTVENINMHFLHKNPLGRQCMSSLSCSKINLFNQKNEARIKFDHRGSKPCHEPTIPNV